MSEDRSNFFGEIRRFARTSGAVGGIAARVAGERYLGFKPDRAAHAEDLKSILGGLKGPLMKVAQFLSTIPDALPDEYAAELAQLQANAPAMGWSFVKRRMAGELGPDWQSRFTEFSQTAAAAASLGQVHRGRLLDGADVACKLQYPDMASTVVMALSKDFALRMSDGFWSVHTISTIRCPVSDANCAWRESTAGIDENPGSISPSDSVAVVMVDAVPMVMQ